MKYKSYGYKGMVAIALVLAVALLVTGVAPVDAASYTYACERGSITAIQSYPNSGLRYVAVTLDSRHIAPVYTYRTQLYVYQRVTVCGWRAWDGDIFYGYVR